MCERERDLEFKVEMWIHSFAFSAGLRSIYELFACVSPCTTPIITTYICARPQGRENALARVRAEQPLKEQLERAVKDALAGNASSAVLTSADDAGPDDEFEGVEFPVPAGTG